MALKLRSRQVSFGLPMESMHEVDFFDVRVFTPLAPTYQHQSVEQTYANHERQKLLAYGERVRRVEHGTLTPLLLTCMGGAGPSGTHFIKRLASKISDHKLALVGIIPNQILFSFSSDKDRRRTDSQIRRKKKHNAAHRGIEPRVLRILVARSNH